MATHSSVLAWRIPGTGEPGGLQSTGSHRVGHDWSDLAAAGIQRSFRHNSHFQVALETEGFPCDSAGEESACNLGHLGSIPGLGRSPGEGKGYQLQYCGLENSMDCIVHGVAKSQKRLSDFHFHLSFPCGSDGKEWAQLEIEQLTLLSCHWKDIQRVCYLSRAALPSL